MAIRSLTPFYWLCLIYLSVAAYPCRAEPIAAVAYHDITLQQAGDEYAVTVEQFREQMSYLHQEGYTPISWQQLRAAWWGASKLPDKPVLLTFDDGLVSYKNYALPILREYHYPSVVAIVTAWVDQREHPPQYQGKILTWNELREIQPASDVEIISHSDNLHHDIPSNPQGNRAPAAVTHQYLGNGVYESNQSLMARVQQDLTQSLARMQSELKQRPTGIAWPYGQYTAAGVTQAKAAGIDLFLTLSDEPSNLADLPSIRRILFYRYRNLTDFRDMLTFRKWREESQRFVELSLDESVGVDSKQQEQNLSHLINRLALLKPTTVIIDPFNKPRTQSWFANPYVSVASDILNRCIHQIRSRVHVDHLYLRLPMLPQHRQRTEIFWELARLNRFDGVLVENGYPPADMAAMEAGMRNYLPALKVITANATSKAGAMHWIETPIGEVNTELTKRRETKQKNSEMFWLLKVDATANIEVLNDALRRLREQGVRHFGFHYADGLVEPENLRKLYNNFHAFVPR